MSGLCFYFLYQVFVPYTFNVHKYGFVSSLQAGVVSLTCQALLLSLAVMLYFVGPMETQLTLFIFLSLVVRSSYICVKVADILIIILRKFPKSYTNSQR